MGSSRARRRSAGRGRPARCRALHLSTATSMARMPSLWFAALAAMGTRRRGGSCCSSGERAVAFLLLHKPGNVSHPNLSFTSPTTTTDGRARRRRRRRSSTTSSGRATATTPRARASSRLADAGPAAARRLALRRRRAARVPARHLPEHAVPDRRRRLGEGDRQAQRPRLLAAQARHAGGRLARRSTSATSSCTCRCCRRLRARAPGNGRFVALSMKNGRVVWSHPVPAGTESSPLVWGRTVVLRRPGGNVVALAPATATNSGPTTPAARSRADRRSRTGSSTSATTPAARTPSTSAPATRSGR